MLIRDATDDDWPQIFPFFSAIVAAGESYAYPADMSPDEAKRSWMAGPPLRTVVAVDDGRVLGSATFGPNRPGRGAHVGTASFMVDPDASGHGVGRALGTWVIDTARTAGYRGIQFNAVVATNYRAVNLWQSLGFRVIGTVPGAFHHSSRGYVGLHVMYLDLTAALA